MKLFNFESPKSWDELVSLKNKIRNSVPGVNRFPEDLEFYQLYTKMVPCDIRLEIIKQLIGDVNYKILQNNFPYSKLLQHLPEVKHYCLWSRLGKLSKKTIESEITKVFPNKPYFWFENTPATKSIPEIWHCQIFVKNK